MIRGHKIDTYLTTRAVARKWIITEHVEVRELHATKGWRLIQHRRKAQTVTKRLDAGVQRECDTSTYISKLPALRNDNVTPRMPKWSRPEREITPHELMRHAERRRDSERAANIARNKLEDQRLAELQ